ncbi:MAG: SAM-dependent methyltransferase [Myxococcales bacterium]|nr:SAM-dependent methyltransferase [Myxococcales bacterium]
MSEGSGRFHKLDAMRDALHLMSRIILSELPDDAHILCAGVGDGPELLDFAAANPGWRFTAFDIDQEALQRGQEKIAAAGLAARCTLHCGTIDTLPQGEPFDAATAFLVSHFMLDIDERRRFFSGIGGRMKPGAILLSADIASRTNDEGWLDLWGRMLRYALPPEAANRMRAALYDKVAVLTPEEVGELLTSAGFRAPRLFFQNLLMHGWYATRA